MGEKLHSPEQLPDLKSRQLVFTWDQDGADSIISYGDQVVWREWTGWEVYDRFAEIAVILQRKYGARLKDLVPTPRSEWALYGDTSRAFGHVESVRAQLAGGKPKKYSYWALRNAVERNDADTIRLYLLAGGYPSVTNPNDGTTLLHVAARYRLAHMARLLIEAGAKVNALDRAGVSPLCQALDEPAQGFETALMPAAYRAAQAVEIMKMLVEGGANLDGLHRPLSKLTRLGAELYRLPLSLAAQYGNVEAVRYLVQAGAKLDAMDKGGMTALHNAILYGHWEAARILVAAGADVNMADPPLELTPLVLAVHPLSRPEHAGEMIRLLAQAGADLDKSDADGKSPLLVAIGEGKLDVVSLLLSLGANVHHRDYDGNGALAHAALAARPQWHPLARMAPIIETLRAVGADPAARNNDGKTARDIAQEYALAELAALL